MTKLTGADQLLALLYAALAQADACRNTLVAALLTDYIAAAERQGRSRPGPRAPTPDAE